MPDFPRDDLIRMTELHAANVEVRQDDPDVLATLHGYAAVFDTPTMIDSWEGTFTEVIARGAFSKTLQERADKVKILFNHGFDPSIGDKPLGKASVLEEDDHGLRIEVPLDDTSYNRDLVALLRSGALDGMSFRFSVVRDSWDDDVRTLREVRLYEAGPVTFPAYEATTAGVRGRDAYQAYRLSKISDRSDTDPVISEQVNDTPPAVAPVDRKAVAAKAARLAAVAAQPSEYLSKETK